MPPTQDYSGAASRTGGRRSAGLALLSAFIGLTPAAASANGVTEDFTIATRGSDYAQYTSGPFAVFNPPLGTLAQDAITRSTPGQRTALLTFNSQYFSSRGQISINLTGGTGGSE